MKMDRESPHFNSLVKGQRYSILPAMHYLWCLGGRPLDSHRGSRVFCVWVPGAPAFAADTEPRGSYPVIWRHLRFFTSR